MSNFLGVDSLSEKERQESSPRKVELATLGGGCFWCTEAVFSLLKGVEKVESGYSGGGVENPTYEQVSTGTTGHAEVIQITFNPSEISYKELLEIFFSSHDPTTLNRQGHDVGTQYRSVIFYHNEAQKEAAEQMVKELTEAEAFGKPIVTSIEPIKVFYRAEEYHKDYFKRHPENSYCRLVIAPKVSKVQEHYTSKLKAKLLYPGLQAQKTRDQRPHAEQNLAD
jgi:peptide-methionine (S)-S-oxide reductase